MKAFKREVKIFILKMCMFFWKCKQKNISCRERSIHRSREITDLEATKYYLVPLFRPKLSIENAIGRKEASSQEGEAKRT